MTEDRARELVSLTEKNHLSEETEFVLDVKLGFIGCHTLKKIIGYFSLISGVGGWNEEIANGPEFCYYCKNRLYCNLIAPESCEGTVDFEFFDGDRGKHD